MVVALAVSVIELNVEPIVDSLDLFLAVRKELIPKFIVLGIARVQLGGFLQYGVADIGVFGSQRRQFRIRLASSDFALQRVEVFAQLAPFDSKRL